MRPVAVRSIPLLVALLVSGMAVACESTNPAGHETDIELEEPGLVLAPGGSGSTTVNVLDRMNFGADIILSAPDPPQGFSVSFDPESFDGPTSAVTVTLDNETPDGEYDVTIRADEPESGDSAFASEEVTLVVTVAQDPSAAPAADFRLTLSGKETWHVTRPGTLTSRLTVAPLERFTGWVRFSVSGLTNDFHVQQLDDVRIDGGTPVRPYFVLAFDPVGEVPAELRMRVTATGPATTHSVSRRLIISLETEPAAPTQPGDVGQPTAPGG